MATTTAATIKAGLTDLTWDDFSASWSWTPGAKNSLEGEVWTDGFFEKVEVMLAGAKADASTEPYKTMNTWYSTNKAAIDAAGLAGAVQVASWAIVVKVTTQKNEIFTTGKPKGLSGWGYMYPPSIIVTNATRTTAAANIAALNNCLKDDEVGKVGSTPKACLPANWTSFTTGTELAGITGTGKSHPLFGDIPIWAVGGTAADVAACTGQDSDVTVNFDTVTVVSGQTVSTPAAGDIGDAVGVYIANSSNKTYKPYALRAAMVLSKAPVIDNESTATTPNTIATPGTASFVVSSWASTWPVPSSWTDIADATELAKDVEPSWDTAAVCDSKKWADATACFGVWLPWAIGPSVAPSATGNGSWLAYHWLADANPSEPTKVFQIEKDAALTLLVWERIVPYPKNIDLTQFKAAKDGTASNSYDLECAISAPQSNWGISTYTHSGASALLGVSAVVAGLAAALF